jgi:hypothetical protein
MLKKVLEARANPCPTPHVHVIAVRETFQSSSMNKTMPDAQQARVNHDESQRFNPRARANPCPTWRGFTTNADQEFQSSSMNKTSARLVKFNHCPPVIPILISILKHKRTCTRNSQYKIETFSNVWDFT